MKSFIDFSENLDDKRKQLMQKQRVMQQMERERASRSIKSFNKIKRKNNLEWIKKKKKRKD